MRLSLNIIGLTTALLLGATDVNANPNSIENTSSVEVSTALNEVVTPTAVKTDAAVATTSVATTKEVKSTHAAELKASAWAAGSAIKDASFATVEVLTGLANLVSPVAHIVIGTVKLGVSATKLV